MMLLKPDHRYAAPLVAVILDENTSSGATRYELSKSCFQVIAEAGGIPFGVPYLPDMVDLVIEGFDGLLATGSRFAFPDAWYIGDSRPSAPESERFDVERTLISGFLACDKPVLGLCGGMQVLAGLAGCKLAADVSEIASARLNHCSESATHSVSIIPGTRLSKIAAVSAFQVNTLHQEAVAEVSEAAIVSACAEDGVIEAIELPAQSFALGVQWHQESYANRDHPGNALFHAFVEACGRRRGGRTERASAS